MEVIDKDLFGNDIERNELLRDKFIVPPFTIIDSRLREYQDRKKKWVNLGIKSEIGRDAMAYNFNTKKTTDVTDINNNNWSKKTKNFVKQIAGSNNGISVFDPLLCEIIYKWFCPKGGLIIDPFAGGSVRGIVANYLGYKYTGIDIRQEQINSNREQALKILPVNNQPQWYVGDSNEVLNINFSQKFDLIFSCPPYADLEVYSELDGDISNMPYDKFIIAYEEIIRKSINHLNNNGFAVFVLGEVRFKKDQYYGLIPDTINIFKNAGMKYYNEAIYIQSFGNAGMRANRYMNNHKLVKVHQNILVFKKI